eukprot:1352522-Karenia_brevis.AAC.1
MAAVKQSITNAMVSLRALPEMRHPSHTVILEAAVYLLQRGLLSVQNLGSVNVKQARALLIWAAWLQHKKSLEWIDDPKVRLPREGLVQ